MKNILKNKGVILFYTVLAISTLLLINDNKKYDRIYETHSNNTYLAKN